MLKKRMGGEMKAGPGISESLEEQSDRRGSQERAGGQVDIRAVVAV